MNQNRWRYRYDEVPDVPSPLGSGADCSCILRASKYTSDEHLTGQKLEVLTINDENL
jgi:hypothetical protein